MPIIPNPPVPAHLKVRIAGTDGAGNVWNNLEYFSYTGTPPSNAVCGTIASDIHLAWLLAFLPNLPPPYTVENVTVTDLSSSTSGEGTFEDSRVGTSTADKVPANVAVVISKIIDARYRGGRPRTYSVVLADENLADPAHINDAYVTTMTTNYSGFITACLAITESGCHLNSHQAISYYGHGGPYIPGSVNKLVTPLTWPIVGFNVDAQLGSQRGRIGRRR